MATIVLWPVRWWSAQSRLWRDLDTLCRSTTWYNCMTSSSLNCLTSTVRRSPFDVEICRRRHGLMRTAGQLDSRPCARAAERRFRRTRSDIDKQAWSDKLRTMRLLYQNKCNMNWKKEIDACGAIWRNCGEHWMMYLVMLLHPQLTLCRFLMIWRLFFRDKVEDVRSSTATIRRCRRLRYSVQVDVDICTDEWNAVTEYEIEKLQ